MGIFYREVTLQPARPARALPQTSLASGISNHRQLLGRPSQHRVCSPRRSALENWKLSWQPGARRPVLSPAACSPPAQARALHGARLQRSREPGRPRPQGQPRPVRRSDIWEQLPAPVPAGAWKCGADSGSERGGGGGGGGENTGLPSPEKTHNWLFPPMAAETSLKQWKRASFSHSPVPLRAVLMSGAGRVHRSDMSCWANRRPWPGTQSTSESKTHRPPSQTQSLSFALDTVSMNLETHPGPISNVSGACAQTGSRTRCE